MVSVGAYQSRDFSWKTQERIPLSLTGGEIARSIESDGGLYVGRLGIARAVNKHLALGIGLDWMIGRDNLTRLQNFENANYTNDTQKFRINYSYLRPTFGVVAGFKKLNLGASLSTAKQASLKKQVISIGGFGLSEDLAQKFPVSWRVGGSYGLNRRSMIVMDYEVEAWQGIEDRLNRQVSSVDQKRWCVGFELLPPVTATPEARRFYQRVPLRVGYTRVTYPFEIGGNKVREQFFSVGSGMYFGQSNGLADLSLQFGSRRIGAGFPEETVVRVVLSLSAFERWVPQPRRR